MAGISTLLSVGEPSVLFYALEAGGAEVVDAGDDDEGDGVSADSISSHVSALAHMSTEVALLVQCNEEESLTPAATEATVLAWRVRVESEASWPAVWERSTPADFLAIFFGAVRYDGVGSQNEKVGVLAAVEKGVGAIVGVEGTVGVVEADAVEVGAAEDATGVDGLIKTTWMV